MNLIKEKLETSIKNAISLSNFNIPEHAEIIRASDRPDLCDFQSNIALSIAKQLGQNPREIATSILQNMSGDFKVDIAGAGFINITLSPEFIINNFNEYLNRELITKDGANKKIIVDYGGPNVAKSMHVGHLRASIIGEALKNLAKIKGYDAIGDIHLGDWGLPMGLIITMIKEQGINVKNITIPDLNKIYPLASQRSKTDDDFMIRAQLETKKLQDGDPENYKIWRTFWDLSTNDIKRVFNILNIEFDLWLGESSVNKEVQDLSQKLVTDGYATPSEGAYVIDLKDYPLNGVEVPPFIVIKSNGAVMYGMTDLATLQSRMKQNPLFVWYVVDSRQSLHFHQVFSASEITKIAKKEILEHHSFGSVLGSDKKPLKTRNGDNMSLEELIDISILEASKKVEENEKTKSLSAADKLEIAKSVAISALKFADLVNPRTTDYIFDIGKFISFEGKTGPYVLYTAVRIKSLLSNFNDGDFVGSTQTPINKFEQTLMLKICEFDEIVDRSFTNRAVNILVSYIYDLCVTFNAFYGNCHIMGNPDLKSRHTQLVLAKTTLEIIEIFANIIKIRIPERM